MDTNEERWRDEVTEKLVKVFDGEHEDLCRILYFLDEEDKAYKDNVARPYAPHWKSLKATVKLDKAFRAYATRLSDETRRAENDPEFRKRLNTFYEQMMSHCDETVSISDYQKLDSKQLLKTGSTSTSAFGSLLNRVWHFTPADSKVRFLNFIKAVANKTSMTAVDDVVRLASKKGGAVVMVSLAFVYLTCDAIANMIRWWKGEISGKRCIKNVLDSVFAVGAGMVGGAAGIALGSAVGPIGSAVGGVVGGWASAAGVGYLSDLMTQKLFGLPKEEALENAYRYLGVKMTASNAEVNTAFRKLCLKHHPDKGGKQDDFLFLQCNMGTIKLARGDF